MNFAPNKLITVDDRDPPWVTENIKKLLEDKSKLYTQYIKNRRKEEDYEKFLNLTTNVTTEISNSKKNYFDNLAEKLCDPKLNRKAYWSILKSFINWKKVSKTGLLCSKTIILYPISMKKPTILMTFL